VLVEAGASGLPVVAVGEGPPGSIVVDGVTGRLCEPDPGSADRGRAPARRFPAWRAKLGREGLEAARGAPGRPAMRQLADGYDRVTEPADQPRIKLVGAA
jgi:glycosyltransferase involved in cell wall biosynthesis